MIYYPEIARIKIEELSDLTFSSEKNNNLKDEVVNLISKAPESNEIKSKIDHDFKDLISEIENTSILKNIILEKNEKDKLELLDELLQELKEMNQLKKIEFLESKAAKNLDENSYSELIELKSQLNRE